MQTVDSYRRDGIIVLVRSFTAGAVVQLVLCRTYHLRLLKTFAAIVIRERSQRV